MQQRSITYKEIDHTLELDCAFIEELLLSIDDETLFNDQLKISKTLLIFHAMTLLSDLFSQEGGWDLQEKLSRN